MAVAYHFSVPGETGSLRPIVAASLGEELQTSALALVESDPQRGEIRAHLYGGGGAGKHDVDEWQRQRRGERDRIDRRGMPARDGLQELAALSEVAVAVARREPAVGERF